MLNHIVFVLKETFLDYQSRIDNVSKQDLLNKYQELDAPFAQKIKKSEHAHYQLLHKLKDLWPQASFLSAKDLKYSLVCDADLVISVGGDEHFKYVVHTVGREKLFLNICSDVLYSQGVLASFRNPNNLEQIKTILDSGQYHIQNWTCLDLNWINQDQCDWVMDTLYIGSSHSCDMSCYRLHYNAKSEEQKSSGILCVTGAGSSGWFKASGGHPFSKTQAKAAFKVREPYFRHRYPLTLTQGVLQTGEHARLQLDSMMIKKEGMISVDSVSQYAFPFGESISISISKVSLSILDLSFLS